MNYMTEIKSFYDWLETNPLSATEIALWHGLMHINNKSGWATEFSVAIKALEVKTGLNRDAVYRARNKLQQAGRITFKERGGNQCSVYTVLQFEGDFATQDATQGATQGATQSEHKVQLLNKLNRNETKRDIYTVPTTQKSSTRFSKPTVEEVKAYCLERNNTIDPQNFIDYYESCGWKIGNKPMKDWKACVRTWERRKKPSYGANFNAGGKDNDEYGDLGTIL